MTDGPGASTFDEFTLHVVDNISPTVVVAAQLPDRADALGPWTAVFNFSEPVQGLNITASLSNAVVVPGTVYDQDSTVFWFDFRFDVATGDPLADIQVDALAGVAIDRAGNPNIAVVQPFTLVRLDVPSVFPPNRNVLSTDTLYLTAGANNPSGATVFQYSRSDGAAFHYLAGTEFTLDGTVGGMRAVDAVPLTGRVDPLVIHLRTVAQDGPADSPDAFRPGSWFFPSVVGNITSFDVNEVIDAPNLLPQLQVIKANWTLTLVPAANDPNDTVGRVFQYSTDLDTWYDLPGEQVTFDGVVPGLIPDHQLTIAKYVLFFPAFVCADACCCCVFVSYRPHLSRFAFSPAQPGPLQHPHRPAFSFRGPQIPHRARGVPGAARQPVPLAVRVVLRVFKHPVHAVQPRVFLV